MTEDNDQQNNSTKITKEKVIEILEQVIDPELQIDIWTLELVYDINIKNDRIIITMTFTTPLCPYGPMLVEDVKEKLTMIKGVKSVDVLVSFEPLWKPSENLKDMLGIGL